MTDLQRENPREATQALLRLEDEDALETALQGRTTGEVAALVAVAPTLEGKTRLLWALPDRQRGRVLDELPAPLIGALVQNLEEENRYLLGDLSLEQFHHLLSLCSADRKLYWIATALSFTDARANSLPLLLSTSEIVEILMTRPAFVDHVSAAGDYPVEHLRLPPDALHDPVQALVDVFGAEGLLREIPVRDTQVEQILQHLLDYDPDRYTDILRQSLERRDYETEHEDEWQTLVEAPVLLDSLTTLAATDPIPRSEDDTSVVAPTLLPVPATPDWLAPLGVLPPDRQEQLRSELQDLYVREAVAAGGSFHQRDLETVVKRVAAYLTLGLRTETTAAKADERTVLERRPLQKVLQTGSAVVEGLRQVAFRLRPLEAIYDARQRAVLTALCEPDLLRRDDGEPVLALTGPDGRELLTLPEMHVRLADLMVWAQVARALTLRATGAALAQCQDVDALWASLAVGAVLYGRVEIGLVEPDDLEPFTRRYLTRRKGLVGAMARRQLQRALAPWVAPLRQALHPLDAPGVFGGMLFRGLERVAELAQSGDLTREAVHGRIYLPPIQSP